MTSFILRLAKRQLRMGARIPWGYGAAWDSYSVRETVFVPIPFNFIAAYMRAIWFFLMKGPRDRLTERILQSLGSDHTTGFGVGYQDGEKAAWRHLEDRLKVIRSAGIEIPDTEMRGR